MDEWIQVHAELKITLANRLNILSKLPEFACTQ